MKVRINGEIKEIDGNVKNISQLLKFLGVDERFVAVELNREVVYKEDFADTALKDGDTVEIVSFVGGG